MENIEVIRRYLEQREDRLTFYDHEQLKDAKKLEDVSYGFMERSFDSERLDETVRYFVYKKGTNELLFHTTIEEDLFTYLKEIEKTLHNE